MGIIIGDVREEMNRDLGVIIQAIRDRKYRDPNYYILVGAKPCMLHKNVIRQGVVISQQRPEVLLGTVLFYVDNEKELLTLEWVWPLDAAVPEEVYEKSEGYNDYIYHNALTPGAKGNVVDRINKRG